MDDEACVWCVCAMVQCEGGDERIARVERQKDTRLFAMGDATERTTTREAKPTATLHVCREVWGGVR